MAVACALVLAACASTPEPVATATNSPAGKSPTQSQSAKISITKVQLSEELEHVHGLVAVKQGEVVAGTHTGARGVSSDGVVSNVGEQRDDLMGFTGEAGTTNLASSGHPGTSSNFPNPMGLITSQDSGKTWKAISLQGEIDFHALALSGNEVVGFGGGSALQISDDSGKSWKQGAAIAPAALAYSGDTVLATTQQGLQTSKDNGQSFGPVENAPSLVLISAGKDQTMLGVDTEGVAWRSIDNGSSWNEVGRVGDVQAIAAYDNSVGYGISETEVVVIK